MYDKVRFAKEIGARTERVNENDLYMRMQLAV